MGNASLRLSYPLLVSIPRAHTGLELGMAPMYTIYCHGSRARRVVCNIANRSG